MLRFSTALAAAALVAGCDSPLPLSSDLKDTKVPLKVAVTVAGTTASAVVDRPSFPITWVQARALKLVISGVPHPVTKLSNTQLAFTYAVLPQAAPADKPLVWAMIVDGERVDLVEAEVAITRVP
ncbi:MAG: hypothetical protein VKO21_07360 [Candidatus Sericytochromatia bacterium]|nr:hypothetical protein [Candidatus Sericytochromatia bacterium]